MTLRWSREALEDLKNIHEFIAPDDPSQADKFIEALIGSAGQIKLFPRSGRAVPEYDHPAIREVIFSSYRIIYRMENDTVEIVTVLHGSRILPVE